MNDIKTLFKVTTGFHSPAPEYIDINEALEKLNWFVLDDQTHAIGDLRFTLEEYDSKPRDLFLDCNSTNIIHEMKKPESRLIINNVLESKFLRLTENIYPHIHHTLEKHNVDPNKVCYMTGNINEHKAYNQWCLQNRINNRIQVFGVIGWWEFSMNNFFQYDNSWHTDAKAKKFLCLNRRLADAPHRECTLYHLQRLGMMNKGLVSSTGHEDLVEAAHRGWEKDIYLSSSRKRIIDADTEELGAGQAADVDTHHLHRLTAFSIVTESNYNSESGTHRFYTEKTLRAALYGHPFVIIGETGANTDIVRLGMEPYTELFDIGTDYINNTDHRVKSQLESIRWDWNSQQMHHQLQNKIQRNRKSIMQNTYNRRQLQQIQKWALNV